MARGDMRISTLKFGGRPEILNRDKFDAVPNTVDFSDVSDTADNGLKVVKAGTPIDKDGKPVKETPWTNAYGILIHDVYEDDPVTAVLDLGYINTTRAQKNSGLTYDGELLKAMNLAGRKIVFEEPIIIATA